MDGSSPMPDVVTARKRLATALSRLSLPVMVDLHRRVTCGDSDAPDAALHRAGLTRSAESYLSSAVHLAAPDWPAVRRLHRAWVASIVWDRAVTAARKVAP